MLIRVDIGSLRSGRGEAVTFLVEGRSGFVWRLGWVKECPNDRRRKPILHEPNHNDYAWRTLDRDEQAASDVKFFEDLLGAERVKAALLAAWEQVKPVKEG